MIVKGWLLDEELQPSTLQKHTSSLQPYRGVSKHTKTSKTVE